MEGWNGQKAFTFYASFADFGDILSEKEQKELYFAIVRYMLFDDDRDEKLTKAARAAFRQIKATLKASRANSKNGSVPKSKRITNESETDAKRKANENATNSKSNTKSKSNTNTEPHRAPAACTKCGGQLERTGAHRTRGSREEYMHVCPKCGTEVWA